MKLFSDFMRTDADPLQAPETSFAFYDRAAGSYWDAMRSTFESWFANIPVDFQPDLRSRLMAKTRKHFEAAFWELYLHELFLRAGFAVQFQPELHREGKTPLTPDFLLERDGRQVYVEAVTVTEPDQAAAEDSRRMDLRESINRRVSDSNFYLEFEIERSGKQMPSLAHLARELRSWLNGLPDPDLVAAVRTTRGVFSWPRKDWTDGDWELSFVAWPKDELQRSHGRTPAIAIGPSFGRVSDVLSDGWTIRDALHRKASKYRNVGTPFVIAVLIRRLFCSDGDVQNALFGGTPRDAILSAGSVVSSGAVDLDGLWVSRHGPPDRHVSAVLSSVNLIPANVANQAPRLWLSPWAAFPIGPLFDFASTTAADPSGELGNSPPLQPVSRVLELADDWPPGDAFPAARF